MGVCGGKGVGCGVGERGTGSRRRGEERGRTGIDLLKKRLNDSKSPKSLSAHCPIVDSFVNYRLLQEVSSLMMAE